MMSKIEKEFVSVPMKSQKTINIVIAKYIF